MKSDNLYPVAIFQDRYCGSYSGGKWVAVAEYDLQHHREAIDECIYGGDSECREFWASKRRWCAVGSTPDMALSMLIKQKSVD